jgi:hypothetical protein
MKTTTRRARLAAGIAALALLTIVTAPALAHHSFAMYDTSIEKTMTGKLIRFVVGANHSQFVFQVVNPDGSLAENGNGAPLIWNVETGAAAQIARAGITVESFKIGTIFTITFSPLRDGRNGGAQRGNSLIMCGMTLPEGGCTAKTGKKF